MKRIWCRIVPFLLVAQIAITRQSNYSEELQAEMRQYQSISQQLNETFEEERELVGHAILTLMAANEPLSGAIRRLPSQIEAYNNLVTTSMLILVVCMIFGLIIKGIAKMCGYSLQKFASIFAKTAKMVIIIFCLLVFLQACAGISGGLKQRQSLNEVLCKLFQEPKGMLRTSQQSQDFQAFHMDVQTLEDQAIKNLQMYRQINSKLSTSKQAVRISKLILPELQKNGNYSAFVTKFAQSFNDLQKTIRPEQSAWLKNIYQAQMYSSNFIIAMKIIIKGIQNYGSRKNFQSYFDFYSFTVVGFFGLAMITSTALLALTIRNRNKQEILKTSFLPYMQYFLIMLIIICIFTFVLTSIIVPALFWTRQSIDYTISTRSRLYSQLSYLTEMNPEITETVALIAPLNKTFSQILDRRFQAKTTEFKGIVTPYLTYNSTYFYDQLKQSLSYISDKSIRAKISLLIQQKEVKQPLIAYFNDNLAISTHIIDNFRQQQTVNVGAFGKILAQFLQTTVTLMFNRSFENHEISGKLIIFLSIIVFLLYFSRFREEEAKNELYGVELGQISADSDLYTS